jgi:hypothetical protein
VLDHLLRSFEKSIRVLTRFSKKVWLNSNLPQRLSHDADPVNTKSISAGTSSNHTHYERGMHYDGREAAMSKQELITQELKRLTDQDLDRLLAFAYSLANAHAEAAAPALAAESSLAKDWLAPEEDAAWARL